MQTMASDAELDIQTEIWDRVTSRGTVNCDPAYSLVAAKMLLEARQERDETRATLKDEINGLLTRLDVERTCSMERINTLYRKNKRLRNRVRNFEADLASCARAADMVYRDRIAGIAATNAELRKLLRMAFEKLDALDHAGTVNLINNLRANMGDGGDE